MEDPTKAMELFATVMSGAGTMTQGEGAARSADFEAKQLDRNAKDVYAQGTRTAAEDRRQSKIRQSNAKAAMAGSGGVTTDVGATNVLSKIEQVGEYNALSALFSAGTQSEGLKTQAKARRVQGKTARRSSRIGSLGTVLTGVSKAYA